MKTRIYISLMILLAVPMIYFTSCNKIKSLVAFDVTMQMPTQHFTYSGTLLKSTEVVLYAGSVNVNLDSILRAYGFSSGTIQTTTFTTLTITMESPPDSSFHWLSSARATIANNSTATEYQIGSVTNTDPTSKTLNVTLNNLNIRQYLSQSSFYLRVYGVLNGPLPAATVGMFLNGTIKMHVSPLG